MDLLRVLYQEITSMEFSMHKCMLPVSDAMIPQCTSFFGCTAMALQVLHSVFIHLKDWPSHFQGPSSNRLVPLLSQQSLTHLMLVDVDSWKSKNDLCLFCLRFHLDAHFQFLFCSSLSLYVSLSSNSQCSSSRSLENAKKNVVREEIAYQVDDPLFQIDAVNFLRLVVDQVTTLDGSTTHEVIFILADVSGE